MAQEFIEVKRDRFHLLNPRYYLLQGNFPKDCKIMAYLDRKRVPAKLEDWESSTVWDRFSEQNVAGGKPVLATIKLPEDLTCYSRLRVYAVKEKHGSLWFETAVKSLRKYQGKPYYYIEEEALDSGVCKIRGWAAFSEPLTFHVEDTEGKEIPFTVQRSERADVVQMYSEAQIDERCGFFIEIPDCPGHKITLVIQGNTAESVIPINVSAIAKVSKRTGKLLKKGTRYLKTYGPVKLGQKIVGKVIKRGYRPISYKKWLPKHLPTERQLEQQRMTAFTWEPKISIVVPLYKTPRTYLEELIRSVQDQTYRKWELCLSDGSGVDSPLKDFLAEEAEKDKRIKILNHDSALKIVENTNAAIAAATGDFIAFADHDDTITPDALFECVKALNQNANIDILYSDEDKMSASGSEFFEPHMKPDFNLDLLRTVNYICHLFVVRKSLLDQIGFIRPEFEGAQDYDLILRCIEASRNIYHVPRVLYHWRCHENSTSENPESKRYAFDAGERAVQAHFDRLGIPALVYKGEFPGLYRTRYQWDEKPLVSILIPNKDHIQDLERCIHSVDERSSYKNYEYIIIENNSEKQETFDYYKKLELKNPKVRVVYYQGGFNFSEINNFGARYARGDYFLLLNNDTEMINEDCIQELLGYCMRPDVGAVGARLYYEDNTVQHAGVVIGFGGIAGHCFVQQPRENTGYCHRIICAQNYSAVTAACMMVKREAFEKVDGLSTELAVAFNDIDFCMKLTEAGYLIVYNPYAELYHYESKSRGLEDTPEKKVRFNRETTLFNDKWPDIVRNGDPYYSPNLTLESQDFSLRKF